MEDVFEMTAEKVPQPFSLSGKSPYVKFVRIEMLDHYGNEHFCPVTLFRCVEFQGVCWGWGVLGFRLGGLGFSSVRVL